MVNAFLTGILSFFLSLASGILQPVFNLLNTIINITGVSSVLPYINTVLNDYILPSSVWFINLIPPLTKTMILAEITLYVTFFAFNIAYGLVLDLLSLIKKLPFA